MQKYNRNDVIANLPKELSPQPIVENIADWELSSQISNLTIKACTKYFASDEFAEFGKEHREELVMSFQVLMSTLERIREFENRTYAKNPALFEPVLN